MNLLIPDSILITHEQCEKCYPYRHPYDVIMDACYADGLLEKHSRKCFY